MAARREACRHGRRVRDLTATRPDPAVRRPLPGGPMDGYYAWMLVAASLVLLMTRPALALFYGGMSRSKSVLNMMMMSFSAIGIVGIVYVLWGWSMSFSDRDVGEPATSASCSPTRSRPFGARRTSTAAELRLRRLPADVRGHHRRADQRRHRRPREVLGLAASSCRIWVTLSYFPLAHMVWGGGFLSGVADGLAGLLFGTATASPRSPDRLRRRHGRPHQRRYRRPGAGAASSASASASARSRCGRTTCR